jgi:hypothetical protein
MSINELVYLFRAHQESRPILLLGAGASFRAGVATAAEAVKRIAKAAYAKNIKGMDWRHCQITVSDWTKYLQDQPWFIPGEDRLAENFPLAVEHLLVPKEFRRRFFEDMIIPPNPINPGYKHLAEMVQRGLCWTILTGNFDHLIVDSFRALQPPLRDIIEINKTADDLVRFNINNRRQVVYLHASVEYYRDRNLVEETQRLDEALVKKLRPLLASSPLVVIGYRGYEPSIMKHLLEGGIKECAGYPQGIYWCLRQGERPHENVLKLQELINPNLRITEIAGFDELMAELNGALKDEAWYVAGHSASPSDDHALLLEPPPFERRIMDGTTLDDLDLDLVLATLVVYCKRVKLPVVDQHNYLSLMREQGLIQEKDGALVPTIGCYLLFGKDVPDRFPYAQIAFTRDKKKRVVFDGNLISQYRKLVEQLTSAEVNPVLRIKGAQSSEELPAFPERALTELAVNMLVHRDYEAEEFSHIEFSPGEYLQFINPGGLLEQVRSRLHFKQDGKFKPVRTVTELRNSLLADIFFGLGPMDKAGSGLADVQELMLEHGGQSEFAILDGNRGVQAKLFQPLQAAPSSSRVARRRSAVEVYTTNLLPFRVIPRNISILPLRDKPLADTPLFEEGEVAAEFPIFISNGDRMISFADFREFGGFATRHGHLDRLRRSTVAEFIRNEDDRRVFVWLVGKHWDFFLRRKSEEGLVVEHKKKRAYFTLLEGERNRIFYDSRARKGVRRDVVKRRERGKYIEHENEGIYYSVVEYVDYWTVQIKPFYMFTGADGITPIPSYLMTQRATRRFKFDRNKNVDDDLTFWARYLSSGQPTVSIGGVGVDDLIVDFEYCSAEVPLASREVEDDENTN